MDIFNIWKNDRGGYLHEELMRYEKLEIEIKQLTGFNFDTLRTLFAMGYTLKPPETATEAYLMSNLYRSIKEENEK